MRPLLNCYQTSQGPGTSSVECPRRGGGCVQISYMQHMAKIHKMVVHHFGFTEKVYEPVTESLRRQWRFALMKEREKTFVAPLVVHTNST